MSLGTDTPLTGRSRRGAPREGRLGPAWGALFAILPISGAVCLLGYLLATAVGRAILLQSAAAVIVLGLLFAWTRANRSLLHAEAHGAERASERRFSVIRVPFPAGSHVARRQSNELPAAKPGPPPAARPAVHASLR